MKKFSSAGMEKLWRLALIAVAGLCAAILMSPGANALPPAYQAAAKASGVPAAALYALALNESAVNLKSGRKPWPWTINIKGTPMRFASRDAACAALRYALLKIDAKRIDAGLAQINLGWNRARFADACDALDPQKNLEAAGEILKQHYDGDWTKAAGRYHRPAGGADTENYRERFAENVSLALKR